MTTLTAQRPRRHIRWDQALLTAALSLGAALMVAPFYWTIVTSFKARAEVLRFPPTWWPAQPTLEHWRGLGDLSFGSFPLFFRNSTFVAGAATSLILLTSAMAGYMFAKLPFRGRAALFWLVLSMMMIPFTVSLIPLYGLIVRLGWTNTYWALLVPIAFEPFGIFLMRQAMRGVPDELLDAARIDGAGEFRIFFRVALPLCSAALSALAIFTFLGQWDSFLWPLVVLNDPQLYTLPLGLAQFRGRFGTDVGGTSAASIAAVLPVLAVYLLAQRQFVEGIALTGLKG